MRNLAAELAEREAQGLYRSRRISESASGAHMRIDGRDCLVFCSNDYLGLANHPDAVRALQQATDAYGVGSGAAHLVTGHSREHEMLEQELAAFTGRERALLFSTGYMANLGVIAGLLGRGDRLFEDRLNHASLLDAAALSHARLVRYRHADAEDLIARLTGGAGEHLIATDGVFSMDGDIAPLHALAEAAAGKGAWLMADDAHGFGVLGERGAGVLEHLQLGQQQVPILMATLGKALGTFGAFVAGSQELIETLIQRARPYIYTTAPPPGLAAATRANLQVLQRETWRREKVQSLVQRFRAGAAELGLDILISDTAIQPLMVGDSSKAVALSQALLERGILVTAMRPPTVPEDTARLRITLSAAHEEDDVDRLLATLDECVRAQRKPEWRA